MKPGLLELLTCLKNSLEFNLGHSFTIYMTQFSRSHPFDNNNCVSMIQFSYMETCKLALLEHLSLLSVVIIMHSRALVVQMYA